MSGRLIALVERGLGLVAGAMVAAMMFITTIDVCGRYLFNRPLFGAFEMTEILMGLVIFAGMPLATLTREHIVVSFMSYLLKGRGLALYTAALDLVCAAIAAWIAWRIWLRGQNLIAIRETTLELGVQRGMVASAMGVLMALVAVAFLIRAWRGLRGESAAAEDVGKGAGP